MIRITQTTRSTTILADIQRAADKLSRTQQRLSSGKELTRPSDDPFAVSRSLQFRADIAQGKQFQVNVREAQAWHDVTDTALSHVGDYVTRARELLVRGGNDTLGPQARGAIAAEIDQIVQAIKGEANAQYAGRYIFSGTSTNGQPYALGASDAYSGNADAIQREIGPNVSLQVNTIGQSVFGDGAAGLLKSLRDISADLAAGNTAALQGADIAALDAAHDTILNERAIVGARTQRLDAAAARLAELEQTQTDLLSRNEDADMAKTMVDFSMQQAVYQSALKSGAQIIQTSLLDFIR